MLLLVLYQMISGTPGHFYWDMVAAFFLSAAVSGDSIILLVYDARWKSSVRDMISDVSNSIRMRFSYTSKSA
jgi:hypothetical protein